MCEEYLKYVSKDISEEINDYFINVALKDSRYLFTSKEGKRYRAYCTHCKKDFDIGSKNYFKHNKEVICPSCKSNCKIKNSNLGRKYLIDKAKVIYYEKSKIDNNVVIARAFYIKRDYTKDYKMTETEITEVADYIFKVGDPALITGRYVWESMSKYKFTYYKEKNINFIFSTLYPGVEFYCSYENIKDVIKGTPLQYSTYEQYTNVCTLIEFFGLYCKYPCIEYINKLGFKDLVDAKLYGWQTCSAINWNGKTLFKVLKINKPDLEFIKKSKVKVTPDFLRLYQILSKNQNLSLNEILDISDKYKEHLNYIKILLKYLSIKKIINYIMKQAELDKESKDSHYLSISYIFKDWIDYIEDCKTLGLDLNQDMIIRPKKLYDMHQNTSKQIEVKESEELNRKISLRIKELNKKYGFEYNGIFIKIPQNGKEIIDEGKKLDHCVGRYAESHANSSTTILFIRKENEPHKPYCTMEIRNKSIIQVRAKRNKVPEENVLEFIEMFKSEKLNKKISHIKGVA